MLDRAIQAEQRDCRTRHALQLGRRAGKVPGVLYGHGLENKNVWVELKALQSAMHQPSASPVFSLSLDGGQPAGVLIKAMQRDALSRQLRHIDLQLVNMQEQVQVAIPIHLQGHVPGEKTGDMLQFSLREVLVRALPTDLPDAIVVDVSQLTEGQRITVSDLVLPTGVELLTEADLAVVSVIASASSEPEAVPAPAVVADAKS